MARVRNGADLLCDTLANAGVEHVFGVPGTQSIDLWEALRQRGKPRPIVATSELAASFMANGYARASGRVGVLVTIPGPGFTYALTGLAEALLDSVAVLHIAGAPARRPDGGYALQAIAQAEVAGPLVKRVITVESAEGIAPALLEGLELASSGEPGPVYLQLPESVLREPGARDADPASPPPTRHLGPDVERAVKLLAAARRPLLLCGQGAAGAAELVGSLAEALPAPVLTTTSGRGVIPETHQCSLPFDSPGAPPAVVNQLVDAADLVLALGVKFSHNGSLGFALRLPPERLIRVDASSEVLARGYRAQISIQADARSFLARAKDGLESGNASTWDGEAIAGWRRQLAETAAAIEEPRLAGCTPSDVFAALRRALSDSSVVATDSGLHQYLVRRHLQVLRPRTLLVPADLQSMGFGIPAAIGAAVATNEPAVAVVGDGGFAIAGLELATAVRAGLPLIVVVLVDGSFGLIRLQQLRRTGHTSGVDLPRIDLNLVAAAVGATYYRLEQANLDSVFETAVASGAVTLVEVGVGAGGGLARARAQGLGVSAATSLLGPSATKRLVEAVRRRRS